MADTWIKGMDVSFLDEIEQEGGQFYAEPGGEAEDCLDILRAQGTDSIRLRLWNDPAGGFCNLERTLHMIKRIKEKGFHVLLDFHYSDKWADPANQWKPKAWENLSYDELRRAVYGYTFEVLIMLKAQGTLPDMVQIGNEITPGMLWNEGRVDGAEYDTDEQWERFTGLVKAGIAAVREVSESIRIMIHIDRGGDYAAAQKFYDRFTALEVLYDVIGLSYYPWWHGTLEDLKFTLNSLALRYHKDIIVVETAYPWTLEQKTGFPLIVEKPEQLHPGYEATPEGQLKYMQDFVQVIRNTPEGRGIGFYYWEPCWIPSKTEWSVGHANNWSNLTMFDYSGTMLPALNI
ncbi:Arabinogalactan endo-1,4-beta-galactosidase precursor [compost metagenome]